MLNCPRKDKSCSLDCLYWQDCEDTEKKDEVRTHWLPALYLILIAGAFVVYCISRIF